MTKRNENKASRAFPGRSEHEAACYRRWAGESGGFLLSHGNDHDSLYAIELLVKVDLAGSDILADWAYGAEKIRAFITEQCISSLLKAIYPIPSLWTSGTIKNITWWKFFRKSNGSAELPLVTINLINPCIIE